MPEVIEKPVSHALDITPITSKKDGKQTGEVIRAALPNISDEDLGNLFDQNSITPEAQYVIRTWHNNCEMDEAAPEWMKNPTPEQNESLQSVPLDARLYKKAMSAIDLEHRKVTKDKGKVATLVVTGYTYDSNGKKVEVKNWTKDGKKLFSAQNKTDIYNFAIRAAATLNHEEQYADNVKQRIKRGFRTIEQRESKSKFVTTMLRPQDAKKKTIRTTGGREVDQETLNRIERLHPDLLDSNE